MRGGGATIEEEIRTRLLADLATADSVSAGVVDRPAEKLKPGSKIRAEDIVTMLSAVPEDSQGLLGDIERGGVREMGGCMRRYGRRQLLDNVCMRGALALGLSVVVGGCSGFGHGDGDAGGARLELVKTARVAAPQGAQVMVRTASEPQWTSCDGKRGWGWTDPTLGVEFNSMLSDQAVLSDARAAMASHGWGQGVPYLGGLEWKRRGNGGAVARAQLTVAYASAGKPFWNLVAFVAPDGPSAGGC
jgi:hypothetical protein